VQQENYPKHKNSLGAFAYKFQQFNPAKRLNIDFSVKTTLV